MRTFVKSLKRLYDNGRCTDVYITGLLENGKITDEEYAYIMGGN